ncbi:MAG: nucleotide exchange factor GrpE, partial [Eubacteriales bacterium]|nr:nucleotide exchange factor GrpE [Eubacteriales bacterium]
MSKREDTEKNKEAQEEIILTEENLDMDLDDAFRDLNDRYLRVCADYDNFRRRSRLDRAQGYEEGVIDTIRQLIPVFESVDSAVKTLSDLEMEE